MNAYNDKIADNFGRRISRREALRLGLLGAGGLVLAKAHTLWAEVAAATGAPSALPAKAKSVIHIVCSSMGLASLDTFDPKPNLGPDYNGPGWGAMDTNVAGMRIGNHLPYLAKVADKFSIVRTMTHSYGGHGEGGYVMATGRMPGGRFIFPQPGAVVARFRGTKEAGYKNPLPPFISMVNLFGRSSAAGFLGINYAPFVTGGNPSQVPMQVRGITAAGLPEKEQQARSDLLLARDGLARALEGNPKLASREQAMKEAHDMIAVAGKTFDLSEELKEVRTNWAAKKHDVRSQYCLPSWALSSPEFDSKLTMNPQWIGGACWIARRLVERGVPYVLINHEGFDTHRAHHQVYSNKLPPIDCAVAALLQELSDRGLLDTTIVLLGCAEFNASPKLSGGGRNHWPNVFSQLVAGGGFKGGRIVGETNETGEYLKERPVAPADFIASIYTLMGIDPDGDMPNPMGEQLRVVPKDGEDGVKRYGILRELM